MHGSKVLEVLSYDFKKCNCFRYKFNARMRLQSCGLLCVCKGYRAVDGKGKLKCYIWQLNCDYPRYLYLRQLSRRGGSGG